MTTHQGTWQSLAWSAVLGLVTVFGSYGLACVFPFAAVAALAAATMPLRRAALLMAAVVAVNQLIGFTLMNYPHEWGTYAWGGVIAIGAFAGLAGAKAVQGVAPLVSLRTIGGLAAAIAAYQAVMFVGAWALDGFASSTPEIVASIVRNDVLWFAGLAALRIGFARVAEPARPALVSAA